MATTPDPTTSAIAAGGADVIDHLAGIAADSPGARPEVVGHAQASSRTSHHQRRPGEETR